MIVSLSGFFLKYCTLVIDIAPPFTLNDATQLDCYLCYAGRRVNLWLVVFGKDTLCKTPQDLSPSQGSYVGNGARRVSHVILYRDRVSSQLILVRLWAQFIL